MIQTIDLYDFKNAFSVMNRNNQFSSEGLEWLFDYCEGLENDLGEPYELDVIALCCDFIQLSYECINRDYRLGLDDNNLNQGVIDFLLDNTFIVNYDTETVLFQQF